MQSARLFKSTTAYCLALIVIGFFMTSLGYLSWLYHLMELESPVPVDLPTMVGGYLLQAVGVGATALICARTRQPLSRTIIVAVLVLYTLCAIPATMASTPGVSLSFGLAMNLFCGVLAGHYLYQLAAHTPERRRALVFGGGYCAASVAQWALGLVGAGTLLHAPDALAVHVVLALAFGYLVVWEVPTVDPLPVQEAPAAKASPLPDNLLPLACTTVLLLSLVKNLGFNFPSTDIGAGVDVELSRLFYAVGLVLAGIITDRHRQYGAICCLAACVTPFIMLALANGSVSAIVLWGLDYFFYGFFTVFRVILFADIAARTKRLWLAGFGLMLGRVGDALGTGINMAMTGRATALIALAALLFVLSVFLFFRLAQCVYAPESAPQRTEQERFEEFAARFDLSTRERQVLRLLLAEQSNSEIAAEMFISESTVKFHVHNLLKKTGCKNRLDILRFYAAASQENLPSSS